PIVNTKDAAYRPMGLTVGPDGELYISDSVKGKIWKVTYKGKKEEFGEQQLLAMEERKQLSHIRTPDVEKDNLMPKNLIGGAKIYQQYCSACHQMNGMGASGRFPPLVDTDWVTGDKERLIKVLLNGMEGSIKIGDEVYNGAMPQHSFLSDKEIAEVLTYIRSSFKNEASEIAESEVAEIRKKQQESGQPIEPIRVTAD
ncbi:MAG: c-type cytochrome, partial [Pricia sp.]|nr:c-type cytochrome [Pricia sp.]